MLNSPTLKAPRRPSRKSTAETLVAETYVSTTRNRVTIMAAVEDEAVVDLVTVVEDAAVVVVAEEDLVIEVVDEEDLATEVVDEEGLVIEDEVVDEAAVVIADGVEEEVVVGAVTSGLAEPLLSRGRKPSSDDRVQLHPRHAP